MRRAAGSWLNPHAVADVLKLEYPNTDLMIESGSVSGLRLQTVPNNELVILPFLA